ncbi:MAG TPA: hypothetical protein PK420_08595 [Rubrivivax sp.]|nr:hypothetical protein [Rubrivivax sp.]
MSHDSQSAGGRAAPASAQQTGFDAVDAEHRLNLVDSFALDIAELATAVQRLAVAMGRRRSDDEPDALVCRVLAERIEDLAVAISQTLCEPDNPMVDGIERLAPLEAGPICSVALAVQMREAFTSAPTSGSAA